VSTPSQFEILRRLISVEENLYDIKHAVESYAAGDEVDEVKSIERLISDTRGVRKLLEDFFAP